MSPRADVVEGLKDARFSVHIVKVLVDALGWPLEAIVDVLNDEEEGPERLERAYSFLEGCPADMGRGERTQILEYILHDKKGGPLETDDEGDEDEGEADNEGGGIEEDFNNGLDGGSSSQEMGSQDSVLNYEAIEGGETEYDDSELMAPLEAATEVAAEAVATEAAAEAVATEAATEAATGAATEVVATGVATEAEATEAAAEAEATEAAAAEAAAAEAATEAAMEVEATEAEATEAEAMEAATEVPDGEETDLAEESGVEDDDEWREEEKEREEDTQSATDVGTDATQGGDGSDQEGMGRNGMGIEACGEAGLKRGAADAAPCTPRQPKRPRHETSTSSTISTASTVEGAAAEEASMMQVEPPPDDVNSAGGSALVVHNGAHMHVVPTGGSMVVAAADETPHADLAHFALRLDQMQQELRREKQRRLVVERVVERLAFPEGLVARANQALVAIGTPALQRKGTRAFSSLPRGTSSPAITSSSTVTGTNMARRSWTWGRANPSSGRTRRRSWAGLRRPSRPPRGSRTTAQASPCRGSTSRSSRSSPHPPRPFPTSCPRPFPSSRGRAWPSWAMGHSSAASQSRASPKAPSLDCAVTPWSAAKSSTSKGTCCRATRVDP